ncbi:MULTISPECIES: preprotein translocase subunit YajC [Leeuwenhoekiella]|jgi:preprotein translocase subunit YajC|uniref:Sec translocon accessory complex subunit YajC n=3 Tax=Leeuwenhoekiella TaxID=283735 RepID=A3XPH5_LEEBM|nr:MULTISPECIES: preprotein translocase subunit YajC [Leeuwenhoekiella]MEC7783604.1 preprotein translocase subunit YajC [Bacteroidota bacterium]EAQ48548.1 preprotein translocase, YajC subunit [Leeuwenhoekiella blandensis MED217]MAO42942.1 preprotein translocase subunit YajC [Leeuwenhoekiella sp.]MAS18856.1 preprotein translocase subunit YajC [Leeuwenhoekiella sp.]MBH11721.1 preprotein translocase subunit YajC [Leeuwenhoekiella sp.]|tara:strand:+ start:3173 stop:3466 length:294 start_codon:yes stop_codon:yes gene_type:complete
MEQITSFLPILLMIAVVYLFMIRPQMKRQKEEKKFAEELKRGDRVITKSGLHGKILDLNDTTVILESGAGKMKFERTALSLELTKKLNEPAKVEKKK